MIRASSALAIESDKRGVLFHGMAGAGKTACALELSHHHSRSQRFHWFVWYKAPDLGKDIDRALPDLAMEMEARLNGLKMVNAVVDAESFRNFLSVLKRALEKNSILIVLDNLESLLASQGRWRDERWGLLVNTLLNHDGFSRTILTSRQLPQDLDRNRLVIEPIHALSLNESILLARDMKNLGGLLVGKSTVNQEKGSELVKSTLKLVQGHPKLIELAEAQAKDPAALERHLEKAAQTWGEDSRLSSFFEVGESSESAEKFLKELKGWTQSLSEALPKDARPFFHFLCALEESDRESRIVEAVWPELWKSLGHYSGQPPVVDELMGDLKALVEVLRLGQVLWYSIHPGVVEAGLAEVDHSFLSAVGSEMANFWKGIFYSASVGEMEGAGGKIIQAGLGAAPYLMKLERWAEASALLEQVIHRDKSPATLSSVIPKLRRIAEATKGTERMPYDAVILAEALLAAGRWQEAETMMRSSLIKFVEEDKNGPAKAVAGGLFAILRETGRYEEALNFAEDMKSYTSKAGLGPWSRLQDEGMRLQALTLMGDYVEVLNAVKVLRKEMEALPEKGDQLDPIHTWNVKEGIFDVGREAAMLNRDYELALEFNDERLRSKKARGATDLELKRTAFMNYYPLLQLERYGEVEKLLMDCKEVYESEKSNKDLSEVFAAFANLMICQGRITPAVKFGEDALRYIYPTCNTKNISAGHNNMAIYIGIIGSGKAQAHELAAAIIDVLTNSGLLASTLQNLFSLMKRFGPESLPASFDQLCETVEEVEGVRFRELFLRLAGPNEDGDVVMQTVLEMARVGKS